MIIDVIGRSRSEKQRQILVRMTRSLGLARARAFSKLPSDLDRIHAGAIPPGPFVPGTMGGAVMCSTEPDREFIARLAAERARLNKLQNHWLPAVRTPPHLGGIGVDRALAFAAERPLDVQYAKESLRTDVGKAAGCCRGSRRVTPLIIQRKYSGRVLPAHPPLGASAKRGDCRNIIFQS